MAATGADVQGDAPPTAEPLRPIANSVALSAVPEQSQPRAAGSGVGLVSSLLARNASVAVNSAVSLADIRLACRLLVSPRCARTTSLRYACAWREQAATYSANARMHRMVPHAACGEATSAMKEGDCWVQRWRRTRDCKRWCRWCCAAVAIRLLDRLVGASAAARDWSRSCCFVLMTCGAFVVVLCLQFGALRHRQGGRGGIGKGAGGELHVEDAVVRGVLSTRSLLCCMSHL